MKETLRRIAVSAVCLGFSLPLAIRAQDYMFTTLAGLGGPGAVDGPGVKARFNNPQAIVTDATGSAYVADSFNNTIRKISTNGLVSTVAGFASLPGRDDGRGAGARFDLPAGLVLDKSQNLFVVDQNSHSIRKVTTNGLVTTFVGSPGQSGATDGAGTDARFNFPTGIAIDAGGNLFVADTSNHTVRKITPAGEVSTLAGSAGSSGNVNGFGAAARFNYPAGIVVANDGTLFVSDAGNHTIRKISVQAEVTTFAGRAPQPGNTGGPGNQARFNAPVGLAMDPDGNIYVADSGNSLIRKVSPLGFVTTIAGDPNPPDPDRPFISFADGQGTAARFRYPYGVSVGPGGNLFVADRGNDAVRHITPLGLVTTLGGSRPPGAIDGSGGEARFRHPTGVAARNGSVFVVDGDNNTLRLIDSNRVVSTIVGTANTSGNVDGAGAAARFTGPRKLAFDAAGNLFVADTGNSTVRKITKTGATWTASTYAGMAGSSGHQDGEGTSALFNALYDVAIDSDENVFVADKDNQVIRKISPDRVVTTFAGTVGATGSADGSGTAAQFNLPYGIAIDRFDTLYVADTLNHTIRKITPSGVVTTFAGEPGILGSEDGVGQSARFSAPYDVAVDQAGNVFVADYFNNAVRKITPDGVVTTIGGKFELDPEGFLLNGSSDGLGDAARFYNPKGIAVDEKGNVFLADSFNNAIRVGTTQYCPDAPIIDQATGNVGESRQLDTDLRTAVAWEWSIVRRPANSTADLSAATIRNPTFTPDVADTYTFELRTTNALGAVGVRRLNLRVGPPGPSILAASASIANGEWSFTFESEVGTSVQVQVSDDLVNWLTLGTFQNTAGAFTIIDRSPRTARGFYRLRQL